VRELATAFACGQEYLASAHVSFVLTARFERGYWKYRRRDVGYAALLMDAGHLSQTLYRSRPNWASARGSPWRSTRARSSGGCGSTACARACWR
jgi:hypothetical protein